ncbi:hypothetical protein ACJ73_02202 [Blastomyces percursus]|uniref:Uncharacterized protein n=1 Tax=Blastomyces percursus TaxID=1658174 RepID=A0A1J9R1Y2_9EURO|nr:hypothetical protein ACJ73_02202 [Blastomyces percursus]
MASKGNSKQHQPGDNLLAQPSKGNYKEHQPMKEDFEHQDQTSRGPQSKATNKTSTESSRIMRIQWLPIHDTLEALAAADDITPQTKRHIKAAIRRRKLYI